jgi:trans-2-enoyl-CoA reductase
MYTSTLEQRIGHGDVFRDITYAYGGKEITYDFCIVLTQDCDLEQDVNAIEKMRAYKAGEYKPKESSDIPTHDKYLNSVLLCPAFLVDSLRGGTHLSSMEWTMQFFSAKLWSRSSIEINDNPRYHFLKSDTDLPDLIVDFKRFFTLPRDEAYNLLDNRKARLDTLFRESVSQRFASFQSRIALPEPKKEPIVSTGGDPT